MLEPLFKIMVETKDGKSFQAFTWCRDEQSGIRKGWAEGERFGYELSKVWAVPV